MSQNSAKERLLERLIAVHPGWKVYDELIHLVQSLTFERVASEYLGNFMVSGSQLVFSEPKQDVFQKWLPPYIPALHGMKAGQWECLGGYADYFHNSPPKRGGVFMFGSNNDEECGFPLIDIPEDIYVFQSNESGAAFFINSEHQILYPNSELETFEMLDSLERFTEVSIKQTLLGRPWFEAYSEQITSRLLD